MTNSPPDVDTEPDSADGIPESPSGESAEADNLPVEHTFDRVDDDAKVYCPDQDGWIGCDDAGGQIIYCPYCGGAVTDEHHRLQPDRNDVICQNSLPGGWEYCPGCGDERVELLTAEADEEVIGYRGVGPGRMAPIFCVDCGSDVNRAVEPIFKPDITADRPPICRSCDAPVFVDDDLGDESRVSLIEMIGQEVGVDHPGTHQLREVALRQVSRRFALEEYGTVDVFRKQLRGYFGWDRDTLPMRKPELVKILRTLRTQEDTSDIPPS